MFLVFSLCFLRFDTFGGIEDKKRYLGLLYVCVPVQGVGAVFVFGAYPKENDSL